MQGGERERRACVMHKEEDKTDKTSAKVGATGVEETPTCEAVTDSTPVSKKCAQNKCDVTIGGNPYCSQCSTAAEYLIDGACKTASDISNTDTICASPNNGKCGSCGNGYFMYKGGCYKFAGELGSLICADPESGAAAGKAGICTKCVAGFFKHPSPANNKQSCIACNETDTIDDVKGVLKCKVCNPPNDIGTATCTACEDGTFVNNSGAECKACTDPCATCTGAEDTKCTSCNEGNTPYFREGADGDGTGTCVAESDCKTQNTHFPTTTTGGKKICILCSDATNGGIADCKTCSKTDTTVTCTACTSNKKPNKAGTQCFKCQLADCSHCNADGVCEACDNSKKVSPGGSSCVTACPENSSDQNGACVCSSGFTPSGDSCAASSSGNLSTDAIAGISVAKSSYALCG